jgi:hypothetical protein
MNPRPIFDAALKLKCRWTGDESAVLTLQDVQALDDALQAALGGHVAPSGTREPRDTLSLRHGRPDGAEGDE